MPPFTIDEEGFYKYLSNGLGNTKDGVWFDFGLKLLANVYEGDYRTRLLKEINEKRIENGWNTI